MCTEYLVFHFWEVDPEIVHTYSMSSCRPVNAECCFFVLFFRQEFEICSGLTTWPQKEKHCSLKGRQRLTEHVCNISGIISIKRRGPQTFTKFIERSLNQLVHTKYTCKLSGTCRKICAPYAHPCQILSPPIRNMHPSWVHRKPVVGAMDVSYAACKHEFRRNRRCHNWCFWRQSTPKYVGDRGMEVPSVRSGFLGCTPS